MARRKAPATKEAMLAELLRWQGALEGDMTKTRVVRLIIDLRNAIGEA
jgi:hypothetical protein